MQTEIKANVFNINTLHGFEKGQCGYCDNKKSINNRAWITSGFVCNKMSLDVYKSLMDKGWRRCGTYYYKADVDKCCCRPYSIRLNVLKHQIRHSHKKALKKFIKFLNPQQEIQEKEEVLQKKNQNSQKNEIIEEENPFANEFLLFLQNELKSEFCEYIIKNSLSIKESLGAPTEKNIIISEEMAKNIKFMKALGKKHHKNNFLTNFLMILFAKNKELLQIKAMKTEEFIDKTKEIFSIFLKDFFQTHKFKHFSIKWEINQSGYIFFELFDPSAKNPKNPSTNPKKLTKIEEEKQQKEQTKEKKLPDLKNFHEKEEKKKENIQTDLELRIEKAKFEKDSYELYQKYCKVIHLKDKESEKGYQRFLCEQALEYESFKKGNEELMCGCYHMKYYYKNKLIAVGVVDILPECLSSVYFFYDPDPTYKKLGLGIVSSLKEIEWIQKKQQIFTDFKYYYLGFYIQNCQKMVYKGDYEPSELLCPNTYQWITLDENIRKIIENDEISAQISPKNAMIIDEMNLSQEEINKIIEKKIKLTIGNRNYSIKELRAPYDSMFHEIFSVLIRLWGKKVVDYLYFGQ